MSRESGPQTGRDPRINPDVGEKSDAREGTSMTKVLAMMLAMMPTLALDGDDVEMPREKPAVTTLQAPQKEIISHSPVEKVDAKATLLALLGALRTPENRRGSPMLDPALSLKKACRVASDWMVSNSNDLGLIWRNLYARKDEWSRHLENDFQKLIDDAKRMPNSAKTLPEFDEKTRLRFETRQAFKCGIGVSVASWFMSMEGIQERGLSMTEHIAEFLIEETKRVDSGTRARGEESVQAMVRLLESIAALKKVK